MSKDIKDMMEEPSRLTEGDSRYPRLLREIGDPPRALSILGALPDDALPKVAIVGTRKATEAGRALSRKIAEEFSRRGIVVVSGLAMGIDAAAHEGAMRGATPTVAVLAGNFTTYPRQNERLAEDIMRSGGALVVEESRETVQPYHFLRRNRIVSGLSMATIIIEAPARSGSLATARCAAEQGRDVFVFPGPASHPNYKGSHALIRDGARLVASFDDILEDLGMTNNLAPTAGNGIGEGSPVGAREKVVFSAIKNAGAPVSIDKIVETTKLEPQAVTASLTMLLLECAIKETEKGYTI